MFVRWSLLLLDVLSTWRLIIVHLMIIWFFFRMGISFSLSNYIQVWFLSFLSTLIPKSWCWGSIDTCYLFCALESWFLSFLLHIGCIIEGFWSYQWYFMGTGCLIQHLVPKSVHRFIQKFKFLNLKINNQNLYNI